MTPGGKKGAIGAATITSDAATFCYIFSRNFEINGPTDGEQNCTKKKNVIVRMLSKNCDW